MAVFERELIRERIKAGLGSAKAGRRKGGKSRGSTKAAEETAILTENYHNEGKKGVNVFAAELKISKMKLYKYIRHRGFFLNSNK